MKKIILFSLVLIFSCSVEEANKVETDLEKEYYQGKIKSVEFFKYDAVKEFGEIVADTNKLQLYILSNYNESGFKTSQIERKNFWYDDYFEMHKKYIFKYDLNNLLTEEEVYNYRTNDDEEDVFKLSVSYKYDYDEFNNLKSRYSNNPSNNKSLKNFSYNDDGKLKEVKYNHIKQVLGEEQLGELIYLEKYTYKDNKETIEVYNEDGSFSNATVKYFVNGLLTEEHYYQDNKEEVDLINYFKEGYILDKSDYYYNREIFWKNNYEYFDYDDEGNFTKEITYKKEDDDSSYKPFSISFWKIEYY